MQYFANRLYRLATRAHDTADRIQAWAIERMGSTALAASLADQLPTYPQCSGDPRCVEPGVMPDKQCARHSHPAGRNLSPTWLPGAIANQTAGYDMYGYVTCLTCTPQRPDSPVAHPVTRADAAGTWPAAPTETGTLCSCCGAALLTRRQLRQARTWLATEAYAH